MTRSASIPRFDSPPRLRAGLLLALFALALLTGVLGHPFSEDLGNHQCRADHQHLESAPDHHHDAAACASCHLFRTLSQSRTPPGGLVLGVSIPADFVLPAVAGSFPLREALFSFASRAPPLA